MRNRSLLLFAALLAASPLGAGRSLSAPVTLSGRVTNNSTYDADSVYVVAVHVTDSTSTTIGHEALPIGPPPASVDFMVAFDNAGAPDSVLLGSLLDVDGSGFAPDSLDDSITNPDVIGWYAGQIDPVFVATASSQSGLDFGMPSAEIRGNVTFAPGQGWAEIEACSIPNSWCPVTFTLGTGGAYAISGLYEGSWKVQAYGPSMEMCYGDVTCVAPIAIPLTAREVRKGIDLDFSVFAVDQSSWGRIKASYR